MDIQDAEYKGLNASELRKIWGAGEVFTSPTGHSDYLGVRLRAKPELEQHQIRGAESAARRPGMSHREHVFIEQVVQARKRDPERL
jgi:hypothetical protein